MLFALSLELPVFIMDPREVAKRRSIVTLILISNSKRCHLCKEAYLKIVHQIFTIEYDQSLCGFCNIALSILSKYPFIEVNNDSGT